MAGHTHAHGYGRPIGMDVALMASKAMIQHAGPV